MLLSVAIGVPIAIFNKIYKIKYMNYLAIIIFIGICGLCFYMTLTNAALMGVEKSNEWAFSYFSSWILDFSFF